jgi:hypothetical protein
MLSLSKDKSIRQIAEELKISKSVVGLTLKKQRALDVATLVAKDDSIPTIEVNETIPNALAETMISQNKADTFLQSIAVASPKSVKAPAVNPKEIAKRDALIRNIMSTDDVAPPMSELVAKPKTKRTYAKKEKNVIASMFSNASASYGPSENSENKASLISRITLNVNTFEPILRDLVKPNKDAYLASMSKKTEQELEITLKTLEHTRSVYNISTQLRSFVYMGSSAIEYGTQRFMKMKTEGFAQALQLHDQEIRMCLAEYCMDKVETFNKVNRPEAKLASILVLTLLSVDAKNRMGASSSPVNAPVAETVAQEYNDL